MSAGDSHPDGKQLVTKGKKQTASVVTGQSQSAMGGFDCRNPFMGSSMLPGLLPDCLKMRGLNCLAEFCANKCCVLSSPIPLHFCENEGSF